MVHHIWWHPGSLTIINVLLSIVHGTGCSNQRSSTLGCLFISYDNKIIFLSAPKLGARYGEDNKIG